MILGSVFMALMATVANNNLAAVFLALAYGSMDAMLPVSWAVCMDVGGGRAGALSGAMNMAGQVASFSSSVAFGWAVKYLLAHDFSVQASYSLPIYPMAALLFVSGLLFLGIHADEPLIPDRHAGKPTPAESPLAA